MEASTLLLILIVHFLADFALQTHEQAINKHKGELHLLLHVLSYSVVWGLASYIILEDFVLCIGFTMITFGTHWITDLITSNMSKHFFDKKDYHNGFVVIGFDQMLHYIQLYLTFDFLLI